MANDNLHTLREKKETLITGMRSMLDASAASGQDMSAEETVKFDQLDVELKATKAQIQKWERVDELESEDDGSGTAVSHRPQRMMRNPGGPSPKKEFESLGEFVATVAINPDDPRLANLWRGDIGANLEMGTGTKGGFMVPEKLSSKLLELPAPKAVIRSRATVIEAGSPPDAAISFPALDQTGATPDNMLGGVKVQWVAEGGTKPVTDFALKQIKLEPNEIAGIIEVTDKLLRNWKAAGTLIERLLRAAIVAGEERAFLKGDGVGKPLGVINSGAAATVNREAADKVFLEDLAAMEIKMMENGGSPIWIASPTLKGQLMTMRNRIGSPAVGDGSLIFMQNAREGMPENTLMNHPLVWNANSPVLGTKGDLILADLTYYLIKDGSGPFVSSSPYQKWENNITSIKIFSNVDGQPWMTAPIELSEDYTVSPFVVLDVPA